MCGAPGPAPAHAAAGGHGVGVGVHEDGLHEVVQAAAPQLAQQVQAGPRPRPRHARHAAPPLTS